MRSDVSDSRIAQRVSRLEADSSSCRQVRCGGGDAEQQEHRRDKYDRVPRFDADELTAQELTERERACAAEDHTTPRAAEPLTEHQREDGSSTGAERLTQSQLTFPLRYAKGQHPVGADGSQREFEIVYGRDVRDWWKGPAELNSQTDRGKVVWTGTNPWLQEKEPDTTLRLYLNTYDNPRPELEVVSIDYVSKMTQAACSIQRHSLAMSTP